MTRPPFTLTPEEIRDATGQGHLDWYGHAEERRGLVARRLGLVAANEQTLPAVTPLPKVMPISVLRRFSSPTCLKDIRAPNVSELDLLRMVVWADHVGLIESPGHGPEWALTDVGRDGLMNTIKKCGTAA